MKIRTALALLTAVFFACNIYGQSPRISESIRSQQGALTTVQQAQCDEFFTAIASSLKAAAGDADEISQLREAVVKQFGRGAGDGFKAAAAQSCQQKLASQAFVEGANPVVRINAAIIAAAIDSPQAASLYADMCKSDFAELRFYGWKGFAMVAKRICGQDNENLKTLLDTLAARAEAETSVYVLTEMVKAMSFEVDLEIPQVCLKSIRSSVIPAYKKIYASSLQAVRDGDLSTCDMISAAIGSLGKIYDGADATQRVAAMEMIAEAMANAYAAYMDNTSDADGKLQTPHSSMALVMTEGEMYISVIRKDKSYEIMRAIARMITQPSQQVLGDVSNRFNEFIDQLSSLNISQPKPLSKSS